MDGDVATYARGKMRVLERRLASVFGNQRLIYDCAFLGCNIGIDVSLLMNPDSGQVVI